MGCGEKELHVPRMRLQTGEPFLPPRAVAADVPHHQQQNYSLRRPVVMPGVIHIRLTVFIRVCRKTVSSPAAFA